MLSKGSVAILPLVLLLDCLVAARPDHRARFGATAPFFVVAVGTDGSECLVSNAWRGCSCSRCFHRPAIGRRGSRRVVLFVEGAGADRFGVHLSAVGNIDERRAVVAAACGCRCGERTAVEAAQFAADQMGAAAAVRLDILLRGAAAGAGVLSTSASCGFRLWPTIISTLAIIAVAALAAAGWSVWHRRNTKTAAMTVNVVAIAALAALMVLSLRSKAQLYADAVTLYQATRCEKIPIVGWCTIILANALLGSRLIS